MISPILNKKEKNLCFLQLDHESRYLALFPYAKGEPIKAPLTRKQSRSLGEVIAKIHLCSNNFKSQESRYYLNRKSLIEDPLHIIEKNTCRFDFGDLSFFAEHSRMFIESLKEILPDEGID